LLPQQPGADFNDVILERQRQGGYRHEGRRAE
jgi:hypothetical protein